eukprot:gene4132-11685_t
MVGAALRDLVAGRHAGFDCRSVPDGVLWRKNAATDWPTHCLPERYGPLTETD